MSKLDIITTMCPQLTHFQFHLISHYFKFNYCYFYSLAPSLSQHLFPSLVSARFRKRRHSSCSPPGVNTLSQTQKCTDTHMSIMYALTHTNSLFLTDAHLPSHSPAIKHTLPSIHKAMLLTLGAALPGSNPRGPLALTGLF